MMPDLERTKIYLRTGSTDLRMGVNGLSFVVEEDMKLNALSGSIFLFCNKDRKLIKALYWDKTGFWLCQKRLEKERWPWPKHEEDATEINLQEFLLLLQGIDFFKAHKEVFYKGIC